MLSEVSSIKRGKYQLGYYTGGAYYHNALTMDIDRWGFWSGPGANNKWRESAAGEGTINNQTMLFAEALGDTDRDATGAAYKKFMLSSVTFPTGGSIEFDYEPHDYGRYYRQEYDTSYLAQWADTDSWSVLAGGARLSKETFLAGDQEMTPPPSRC